MSRGHADRVADILAAIDDIQSPTVIRSVLYSIDVIGEAVKAIDPEFKAAHPDIPWRTIAGIRDRIVHENFSAPTRGVSGTWFRTILVRWKWR